MHEMFLRHELTDLQYHVDPSSVRNEDGLVTAVIKGGPAGSPNLDLQISVTAAGVPRVRITEPFTRWEVLDIFAYFAC